MCFKRSGISGKGWGRGNLLGGFFWWWSGAAFVFLGKKRGGVVVFEGKRRETSMFLDVSCGTGPRDLFAVPLQKRRHGNDVRNLDCNV